MTTDNNKRIAKNTIFLYFRMLLTMSVSLYTSRVIIHALGISDFGVYNVVGGIVAMFSFLNWTLASGTERFLVFAIGENDLVKSQKTYSIGLIIHLILAIIVLILAETIGYWFLNYKMNIPINRIFAANCVFQFSVFASLIAIIQAPFNSCIIAHEHMNIYAYMSILDVTLKLLIVYLLGLTGYDKLIVYAFLIFSVQLLIGVIYRIYCIKTFEECKFRFVWDKELVNSMISFSGWNIFGCLAMILLNYGTNIMLNIFFGTIINAARGISYQVNSAISSFVNSFQTAVSPQIVKLYASDERDKMHSLIINNSKYALYLMLFLLIPIFLEIDFILSHWLKEVPEYTALFCRLILIQALFIGIDRPIVIGVHATGKMKALGLSTGAVYLSVLPISYVLLKLGANPYVPFIVGIISFPISMIIELFILKRSISYPINKFLKEVIIKGFSIMLIASILPVYFHYIIKNDILRFIIVGFSSIISVLVTVYFGGLNKDLKIKLNQLVKSKLMYLKSQ